MVASSKLTKDVEIEGTIYKIKVFEVIGEEGIKYVIRVFLNRKPANGYSYSVKWSENNDFKRRFGETAISYLMKHAEEDIKSKMWEKYLNAIQELQNKGRGRVGSAHHL